MMIICSLFISGKVGPKAWWIHSLCGLKGCKPRFSHDIKLSVPTGSAVNCDNPPTCLLIWEQFYLDVLPSDQ